MLGLPTQSGSGDGKEEQRLQRQVVRWRRRWAVRRQRGRNNGWWWRLFWSGFESTKYMDKIHRRMYERWNM